jgi:hypothetical protein
MLITLSIFYYLFLAVVFIFVLYTLFNFYHLLRFGFFSVTNISVILAYLVISGSLLYLAFTFLSFFDWSTPLFEINFSFFTESLKFFKL